MTQPTATALVAAAKQRIENLTVEETATEFAGGEALLVDVREPEERRQNGVIPGAVHAPRGMIEFYADPTSPYHRPEFDPTRRLILQCASGSRSALAADALRLLGYGRVAHLDGGLKAWKEAGRPVALGAEQRIQTRGSARDDTPTPVGRRGDSAPDAIPFGGPPGRSAWLGRRPIRLPISAPPEIGNPDGQF